MKIPFPLNQLELTPQETECCQKILMNPNLGGIARHLNKRFSLPASIYLARKQITPNQITLANLALGILSGIIASHGSYFALAIAGILFQIVSIIDGCDGEVAKLNLKSSRFGAWFDTAGDNISFMAFITGVTFGLYHVTREGWIILATQISLLAFVVLLGIMISYLIRKSNGTASLVTYEKEVFEKSLSSGSLKAKILHYAKYLVKKDFFAFFFSILSILNLPKVIVICATAGTSCVAIVLLVLTLKSRFSIKAPATELASKTPEEVDA